MIKIYFLLILLICNSCIYKYSNKNEKSTLWKDSITLSFQREFSIIPDANTPSDWSNTFAINTGDSSSILIYNTYTGDFNFFNSNTAKLSKSISTKFKQFDGISVYNDTIVYVQDYKECTFLKTDLSGIITDTIEINSISLSKGDFPPSYISIFNGVYPINNHLLHFDTFTAGENDANKRYCGMLFDVRDKSFSYTMFYPPVYQKANWGGGMYRRGYTCYNSLEKIVFYSFPASHYIYFYDFKTKDINRFYAGSKFINEINAFSKDRNMRVMDSESFEHYRTNDNYGAIIYDRYRNLYYRIAEKANYFSEPQYKYLKQLSIIIFNSKMEIVGEKQFNEPYGTTLLVTPEGVFIPYLKNIGLDLPMTYHVFKITPNSDEI